ncbi:unnamed protein product [Mytilus coruscus]|uniref:Reverse transcriptase domain-containing protein n=1 Tax=Mytilus coruscus TaxID=42192 RepID=A0A6J8AAN8_MYTCO|nr:unnamed protein product [Mytilus coruscus]
MAGYIGKIENFNDGIEQWTSCTERLEQYFAVNEINNDKRVPALLSLIGGKTCALLRNLTTPDKPKDKSYEDIVKVLKEHLSPAPLLIPKQRNVKIDNKFVEIEVDTGSALSIIPKKEFDQMFPNRKLDSTDVILRTFSGEKFKPLGVTAVNVNYNDQIEILSLYVVQKGGGILFGRDWLRKIRLDWSKINKVSVENVNVKTKELLDQHASVFSDNIGCVKGIKGNLIMKDNVKPVFMKARPIPYALRPKVEQELDRLEEEGIISKVPTSEWATPIVPVVKKSGGVRICGDFKVTINQQLQVDQYPLPRIDDIFASLSGGENFSKIDLRQAYLQLEMNEESKKYLTINTHRGLYQYSRMLFGVASAPAIWQKTIDQILQGLTGVQCILDDMVITVKNDREHLVKLDKVMKRLEMYNLSVN